MDLGWNICVVTDCREGGIRDLNNSLLYGSKTIWLPPQHAKILNLSLLSFYVSEYYPTNSEEFSGILTDPKNTAFNNVMKNMEEKKDDNPYHALIVASLLLTRNFFRTRRNLRKFELNVEIPEDFYWMHALEMLRTYYGIDGRSKELSKQGLETVDLDAKRALQAKAEELVLSSHGAMIYEDDFSIKSPNSWTPHQYALELMNAMQQIHLPDVSTLELGQIKDLHDRAKDELEPMRAEMLRLTEDLRKMIGDDCDTTKLAREAENLIATRVEPPIRELRSRINSDLELTKRGYKEHLLKSIGLLGVGFLTHEPKKAITDVLSDTISFLASKWVELPLPKASTAAARFVIEIDHGLKKQAE